MQVTKGAWRMREQCVPDSLSSSPAQEPGDKARLRPAYRGSGNSIIGASLSEPHASVTALAEVVCMYVCLRPYTVNFK